GPDDGPIADRHSFQDHGTGADPDLVADYHGPNFAGRSGFTGPAPGCVDWMAVEIANAHASREEAMPADLDQPGHREQGTVADEGVVPDPQLGRLIQAVAEPERGFSG